MEEAELLCDRVVIVDHGRILAEGTLAELRAMLGQRDLVRFSGVFQPVAIRQAFTDGAIEIVQAEESTVTLAMQDASRRLPDLIAGLHGAGGEIRSTTLAQPSLESLFLKLTGKELRE
jgi:ABC-2 type transport system ATP-binding protein